MPTPAWFHLTARVTPELQSLCSTPIATWLWPRLRLAFPDALAVCLMPDHLHSIVLTDEPHACELRLARLLGQLGRCMGAHRRVCRVAPAEANRSQAALARHVRYVALNPCRKRLASCPLAWLWSTHRDVIGATADPWVTADRMRLALGSRRASFVAEHHAYVSADPHAHVEGTALPQPATPTDVSVVAVRTIVDAVTSAIRCTAAALEHRGHARTLFVALAYEQGWDDPARLAKLCACQPRAIRSLLRTGSPHGIEAARLCLGDARLRGDVVKATFRAA